jgi:ribosomal protein S18 acetylase RimI-like enzyme
MVDSNRLDSVKLDSIGVAPTAFDSLRLRAGTAADLERIVRVRAQADCAFRRIATMAQADELRTRRYLALPDAFSVVAEKDTDLAGFATAMHGWSDDSASALNPSLCHLGMVFVAPSYWGRGIGAQLVGAMLHAARKRGYDRAQLWTQTFNLRAQRLYLGQGFARTGRSKQDEHGDTIELYARSL